jgi:hypothetical protein
VCAACPPGALRPALAARRGDLAGLNPARHPLLPDDGGGQLGDRKPCTDDITIMRYSGDLSLWRQMVPVDNRRRFVAAAAVRMRSEQVDNCGSRYSCRSAFLPADCAGPTASCEPATTLFDAVRYCLESMTRRYVW